MADFQPADTHSIRGRLRFLMRDSAMYGGAASLSKAFALITFPIVARHFSTAEYGALDYCLTLTGLIATFLIFGQDSAVARYFYEHEDPRDRRQLISQSLLLQIAAVAIATPTLWFGADRVASALLPSEEAASLLRVIAFQLPFLVAINFSQNLLKWTFARAQFLTISLGMTVVQSAGIMIAVLMFNADVRSVLLVCLGTSAIFGTLGLIFVRKWMEWPRNLQYVREMLSYAAPFGVICVAGAFSSTLERTLTDRLLGSDELGLYAAAAKVAMLVGLLVGAFQTAWGPLSLSIYRQPGAAHTYNQVLRLFSLAMCLAVLVLMLGSGLIISVLASGRYSGAAIAVFPLAMGLGVQATSWITELGIGLSKRSHLSLYPYCVSLAVTLGAIWTLAPTLGIFGVGCGVLLGSVSRALVASWLAQRAYPMPWTYAPVILIMSATTILGLLATWSGQHFGEHVQTVILVSSILCISLAGWRILFSQSERVAIRDELLRKTQSWLRGKRAGSSGIKTG
jgi:O-antigen/teichoic acid export membrane protein